MPTRRDLLTLLLVMFIAALLRLDAAVNLPALALSLIVLAALWGAAQRYLNPTAALVAGMVYAVSPWALFFSGRDLFTPLPVYPGPVFIGWLAGGLGLETALTAPALLAAVPRPGEIWLLLLGGVIVLGIPALWLRSKPLLAGVIAGLALVIVMLALIPAGVALVTLVIALPALSLLAGAGVAWLSRLLPGGRLSRAVILAAVAVVLLSQALWWRGALRYVEQTTRAEAPVIALLPRELTDQQAVTLDHLTR